MKLELSGDLSNHSDLSNDQQNSNLSSNDFIQSAENTTAISTSFISLDGLSSGVPTQTTPTLTPTTLRNIEQTFIELQNSESEHRDQAGFVPPIVISNNNNQYQLSTTTTILAEDTDVSNKSMWTNSDSGSGTSVIMRPTPPVTPQEATTIVPLTTGRRNGGRRPNKNINMTPEEELRRNMRRERNKIAAARCRKRRLDHTNALLEETEGLEQKKIALQNEIEELQAAKEELQYVLERHRANCRIQQTFAASGGRPDSPPDIKPIVYHLIESADESVMNSIRIKEEVDSNNTTLIDNNNSSNSNNMHGHSITTTINNLFCTQPPPPPTTTTNNNNNNNNKKQQQQQNNTTTTLNALNTINNNNNNSTSMTKANRPSSLNVPAANVTSTFASKSQSNVETIAGIPITTPSAALPFNFDSLMEGGTGLTPVSGPLMPTTSTIQHLKNSIDSNDLVIASSSDTNCSSKLVSL